MALQWMRCSVFSLVVFMVIYLIISLYFDFNPGTNKYAMKVESRAHIRSNNTHGNSQDLETNLGNDMSVMKGLRIQNFRLNGNAINPNNLTMEGLEPGEMRDMATRVRPVKDKKKEKENRFLRAMHLKLVTTDISSTSSESLSSLPRATKRSQRFQQTTMTTQLPELTTIPTATSLETLPDISPLTEDEIEGIIETIHTSVASMKVSQLSGFPSSQNITLLPNFKNPCWRTDGNTTDSEAYHTVPNKLDFMRNWKRKRGRRYKEMLNAYNKALFERNKGFNCLPYFFIAGFPKSGTTDLFAKVLDHPQVLKGRIKEPHFWTRMRFHGRSFDFYQQFFSSAITEIRHTSTADDFHNLVMTEGSASTAWDNRYIFKGTTDPASAPPYLNVHALYSILPSAKFVLILRNPSERLYSDYLFFQKGFSPEEFHQQAHCAIQTLTACLRDPDYHPLYCMYATPDPDCDLLGRLRLGLYYIHISILFSVYPRENVFITRLEDYTQRKVQILDDIFQFLELEPMDWDAVVRNRDLESIKNKNKSGYKIAGGMLNSTRTLLDEFYRPFNHRLAQLLNNHEYTYE